LSPVTPANGSGGVTLESLVLVSPASGTPKVDWHRNSLTIEPRGGFRPNTSYRVTILPGLSDLRNNVQRGTTTLVFSTGPKIAPYSITGRVFDWTLGSPAAGAVVDAIANAGTADSLIYRGVADSLGQFDVGPLDAGTYLVRTFIDADRNRERGVLEKWDTSTVTVTNVRPAIELLAAQRDTAAIGITRVEAVDSLWLRIALDKPFDPRSQLVGTMVSVKRADSTDVPVAAVMTESQAAFIRPRPDSAKPVTTAPPARANPSAAPPPPRPRLAQPENVIMVQLGRGVQLRPGEQLSISVRGLRNLLGNTGTSTAVFEVPKRAAPPPE
jgi:hypothetical protein